VHARIHDATYAGHGHGDGRDFIPYIEGAYKAGGGTIVANETLTPGLTSYRTEALKVARAGTPKGA